MTTPRIDLTTLEALRCIEGLGACEPKELQRLCGLVDHLSVAPGVVLLHEGVVSRQAFVVVRGMVAVTVGHLEVARLGRGQLVGEMSMLDHQPCSATVTAVVPTTLLVIGPAAFGAVTQNVAVSHAMTRALSRRLREANAAIA